MLRTGQADLVLNDQRRAFSEEYVNLLLATCRSFIEVAAHSPLSQLSTVTPPELKIRPAFWWQFLRSRKPNRITIKRCLAFRVNFCLQKPWRKPG